MDRHLSETDLEAAAHGREDLLSAQARRHLGGCELCAETVSQAQDLSESVGLVLREQLGLDALFADDLVSAVLNDVSVHEVPAPPRTTLLLGLLGGLLVALATGVLAGPKLPSRWPSLSMAYEVLRVARAVMGAFDRQVISHLPGGWGLIMVSAWLLLALLTLPARMLVRRDRIGLPRLATGLMLLALVLVTQPARAFEVEGELPEQKRVSLRVTQEPTSRVLARVADLAGLNLVSTLPDDPLVSVRVKQVTLREVLTAVLGEQSVVVRVEGTMLTVRGVVPAGPASPEGAALPAPTSPASPAQDDAKAASSPDSGVTAPVLPAAAPPVGRSKKGLEDRLVVGDNDTIAAGEHVLDAIVLGGNLTVFGVIEGDAAAIGGNLHLMPGSVVKGELFSLGGSVTQEKGASVLDRRDHHHSTHDGHDDDGMAEHAADDDGEEPSDAASDDTGDHSSDEDDEDNVLSQTLSSASSHALLFVFGLVLLGIWPRRVDALQGTLRGSPVRTFALGLLGALGALVLCVLLAITLIGIPAAIVLALTSALAVYAGVAAAALAVGRVLPFERLANNSVLQLGAGVFVLFLLGRIPVLGGVLFVMAAALGFGAILRTRLAEAPFVDPGPSPPADDGDALAPDEAAL